MQRIFDKKQTDFVYRRLLRKAEYETDIWYCFDFYHAGCVHAAAAFCRSNTRGQVRLGI